jgi:hypothetical protein
LRIRATGTRKIKPSKIEIVRKEDALPNKTSNPKSIKRIGQNFQMFCQISQGKIPKLLSKKTMPRTIIRIGPKDTVLLGFLASD